MAWDSLRLITALCVLLYPQGYLWNIWGIHTTENIILSALSSRSIPSFYRKWTKRGCFLCQLAVSLSKKEVCLKISWMRTQQALYLNENNPASFLGLLAPTEATVKSSQEGHPISMSQRDYVGAKQLCGLSLSTCPGRTFANVWHHTAYKYFLAELVNTVFQTLDKWYGAKDQVWQKPMNWLKIQWSSTFVSGSHTYASHTSFDWDSGEKFI